jgi:hypothetical protein
MTGGDTVDDERRARFEAALQERIDAWNRDVALVTEHSEHRLPLPTREDTAVAIAMAHVLRRMNNRDDPERYIAVFSELMEREVPALVYQPSDPRFVQGIDGER